ncbi:MAG: EamA family transporter [Nanoarchaeota archaeon]
MKENTSLLVILLVLFCALLGATGQLFFKLSSQGFSLNPLSWLKNYKFLVGAFLYAISAALFVYSLKHGNLSLLYPIIATSYIWVALFSTIILNEPFPVIKWLGIGLIIFGIFLIMK